MDLLEGIEQTPEIAESYTGYLTARQTLLKTIKEAHNLIATLNMGFANVK